MNIYVFVAMLHIRWFALIVLWRKCNELSTLSATIKTVENVKFTQGQLNLCLIVLFFTNSIKYLFLTLIVCVKVKIKL